MDNYVISTPSGSRTVKADKIEERTSHFVLIKKRKTLDEEDELVAVCPKTTQFIIVKEQ